MALPSVLGWCIRLYFVCWEPGGILYQLFGNICTLSWLSRMGWCRRFLPEEYYAKISTHGSVLAPDAGISDVAIVVCLSLTMAVVRVTLVHFLVPNYKQPKRLEALVKCKSIHLLSSQYPGSITPRGSISHKVQDLGDAAVLLQGLAIPNLHSNDEHRTDMNDEDSSETAPGVDAHSLAQVSSPLFHTPQERLYPAELISRKTPLDARHNIGQNPKWLLNDDYDYNDQHDNSNSNWGFGYEDEHGIEDDEDADANPAPAVSSGLLTNSSAQNLMELLEKAAPHASTRMSAMVRSNSIRSVIENGDRIFAAPKYATAVFRLMFCLLSCLVGLFYFAGADFWPPAVGGKGQTKNCWDLASVGATIMDSDFDQRNTVLRRYYLLQASYHFHSAAFHVLTSLLLWFVSKTSKSKDMSSSDPVFLGFIPAGMLTLYNIKTFFQHCFSIATILVTYLFSSTRRLGAIAMFTFDASSAFLHLLQMGINAPRKIQDDTQQRSIQTSILLLHRLIVIPAFCYARFYVFPFVVAYSALEESQDWLRQLENMLIPGTAQYIHSFFVVAFLLFLAMNFVYFFRLLNHPHVLERLSKEQKETEDEENKTR
jgi:hypothetical protein